MTTDKLLAELNDQGLEVVIGLETHIRLNTKTKLFCSCPTAEADLPNEHICSVCTGQMGVLPAVNKEAIKKAILFGKAVNSSMHNRIICWDRKHYEYPDLPKNFQLTQFTKPIIPDGYINCFRNDATQFRVDLEQVHIEEDAAKLMHDKDHTLVDFNKASVPLIEVVTKPCMHSIMDAPVYAQNLQRIVQILDISEANLEKGEFKSDVSVSLRKKGTNDLNPRAEIKNLNSFKFMAEAIVEEITKQLEYYLANKSFRPDQTTVLFDADLKKTKTMRKKEYAADYRFAIEPDIPYVNIAKEIDETVVDADVLPYNIESILIHGGVKPQDAKFFTSEAHRSKVFMAINAKLNDPLFLSKALTNNVKAEEYDHIRHAEPFARLFAFFKQDAISVELLQKILKSLYADNNFDLDACIKENTISDEVINAAIVEIIEQNAAIADEIRNGNVQKVGILVGKFSAKMGKNVSGKVVKEKFLNSLSAAKKLEQQQQEEHAQGEVNAVAQPTDANTNNYTYETVIKNKYRTHYISDLSEKLLNEKVTLAGWISSIRDHGELIFIDLRDSSYEIFQVKLTKECFPEIDKYAKLNPETVIMVTGTVIQRNADDFNPNLRTGKIEMDTKEIDILNLASTLPFEIRRAHKSNEHIRLKYKYLDHRNQETRKAIINRHKIIKEIRDILCDENFLEIETPILSAGTDEGAREFIVPSRKFPKKFYSLPQSPQQYKQIVMCCGYEKYFQLARCFRDEDSRGDRQPEFTQLDIEMSYVGMQDIIDVNTNLLNTIIPKVYGQYWKLFPFRVITYQEAMLKYGCDRPDLRYDLEMQDITDIVKDTTFKVFADSINSGGIVKCIKVDGTLSAKRLSKGQIESLMTIAQSLGLGGLAYIIVNENELQSPIIKYLGEEISANIIKATKAVVGDIVFFSAADYKTANKALDAVRQELARMLNLIKPRELHPAWVIDFPQFEETDEGGWTFSHNPFSMPKVEFLQDHLEGKNIGNILAQQYDLILNGYEIGGGSVRAHHAEILRATYKNMGYDHEATMKSVGHMIDAFQYGAPPHGGIAWGIDRLMMILEEKSSIREVIPFPKTGSGEEVLFGSPSVYPVKKLADVNIKSLE